MARGSRVNDKKGTINKPKTKDKKFNAFTTLFKFLQIKQKPKLCSGVEMEVSYAAKSATSGAEPSVCCSVENALTQPINLKEPSRSIFNRDHSPTSDKNTEGFQNLAFKLSTPKCHSRRVGTSGLSKSWSYFTCDLDISGIDFDNGDEYSDQQENACELQCQQDPIDSVLFIESYFEDDYCQPFNDYMDENANYDAWSSRRSQSPMDKSSYPKSPFESGPTIPHWTRKRRRVKVAKNLFPKSIAINSKKKHASAPNLHNFRLSGFSPTAKVPYEVSSTCETEQSHLSYRGEEIKRQQNPKLGLRIAFDGSLLGPALAENSIIATPFLTVPSRTNLETRFIQASKTSIVSNIQSVNYVPATIDHQSQDANTRESFKKAVSCQEHSKAWMSKDKPLLHLDLNLRPLTFSDSKENEMNPTSSSDDASPMSFEGEEYRSSTDEVMVSCSAGSNTTKGSSKVDLDSGQSSSDETMPLSVPKVPTPKSSVKKSHITDVCISRRRSVESGYDSCKTPSIPSSPSRSKDLKLLDSVFSAMSISHDEAVKSLSSIGNVTPVLLRKLDGLSSPLNSPSKTLKTPFNSSPPFLEAVPEASEVSNLSVQECSIHERQKENAQSPTETSKNLKSDLDAFSEIIKIPDSKTEEENVFSAAKNSSLECFEKKLPDNLNQIANREHSIPYSKARVEDKLPDVKLHKTDSYISPCNRIPAPLSTSSPLRPKLRTPSRRHKKKSHSSLILMSPVTRETSTASKSPGTPGCAKARARRKKEKFCQSSPAITQKIPLPSSPDLNNNVIVEDSSDEEIEVISPASRDYLLLKRASDSILYHIPTRREYWSSFKPAAVIEFLNSFYLSEISKIKHPSVRSISDLRNEKFKRFTNFNAKGLTTENCIAELMTAALIPQPSIIATCADFAFENLHEVRRTNPHFMRAPPELILMILGNDRKVVLGPHGFPLTYKDSEREVYMAAVRYADSRRSGNVETDRHLRQMLLSVVDPKFHHSHKKKLAKEEVAEANQNKPTFGRPIHDVTYKRSGRYVSKLDTRQEYLFQPFLSSTQSFPSSGKRVHEEPIATQKSEDENDLAPDVLDFCNSAHTLRKLYFTYRRHNHIPYITRVGFQYAHKGKRKAYQIGAQDAASCIDFQPAPVNTDSSQKTQNFDNSKKPEPNQTKDEFLVSADFNGLNGELERLAPVFREETDSDSHLEEKEQTAVEETMTALKLGTGEHVTGVALQGDAVLHNIEIATNKGRRVRAHPFQATDARSEVVKWTPMETPSNHGIFCLQALSADAKNLTSMPYLRNVEAVWAIVSRPTNINDLGK